MFAIAPAYGTATLSGAQVALLVGKARWIFAAASAGFPVVPSIAVTRSAWDGLQAERYPINDWHRLPVQPVMEMGQIYFDRQARESNQVIARRGWTWLARPIPIRLEPRPFGG